jgi:hypothetical protein
MSNPLEVISSKKKPCVTSSLVREMNIARRDAAISPTPQIDLPTPNRETGHPEAPAAEKKESCELAGS